MLDIKPFKQPDDSLCGPASVKMVLDYYKISAPIEQIAERCGHSYELGCNDLGMKAALESYGLAVEIKDNCSFDDIKSWLDKGVPVIVDWFSSGVNFGLLDAPNGHSSIVIGLGTHYIYLMDPECGGIRQMAKDDFMRVWFDWRSPYITSWEDMIIRQIIVAYDRREGTS